jgi:two-component system CheB/CheR fusion protein
LQQDCESVLKTLASTEVEVETLDGVAYLMRIMPYRTSDNVIEGLVLTFINVHRRKLAEMDSREKEYFRSIFNAVIDPLVVLDGEMRIVSANQSFYQNFNLECKQVEGALLNEIGAGRWDNSRLQARLQKILTSNDSVAEFELPLANSESSSDIYYLNARRLTQSDGKPDLILLSMSMHKP